MIQTRRKSDVAADQSGNVRTNGELEDVPHVSDHRRQQSGMKTELPCWNRSDLTWDAPMTETLRKGVVAADRSGNVRANGQLEVMPHASEHRWQQSGTKTDLRC